MFKDNDFLWNIVYRYELLVIVEFICLLVENEDVVVVDKFFFIFVYFCGCF